MSDIGLCGECKNRLGKFREKEGRILCDDCFEKDQIKSLQKEIWKIFTERLSEDIYLPYASYLLFGGSYPVVHHEDMKRKVVNVVKEFNIYMEEKDKCQY